MKRTRMFIIAGICLLLLVPLIHAIGRAAQQSIYLPLIERNRATAVPGKPDLEITGIVIQLETGNSCAYTSTSLGRRVHFRNNGSTAISVSFAVRADNDQLTYAAGLAGGQSASLWFPGGATIGEHSASIDVTSVVDESDESNNTYQGYLPIPTLPPTCTPTAPSTATATATSTATATATSVVPANVDLEVYAMSIELESGSSCAYASTTLGRRVYFRNNGPAAIGVSFAVQADNDQLTYTAGLASGQSASLWFSGDGGITGQHTSRVDATSAINETNEGNNTYQSYLVTPTLPATCTPTPVPAGAVIVDHHHTNLNAIPAYWLGEARKFAIHYAHTSHGSQVLSGLSFLAGQDAKYAVCTVNATSGHDPADLATECTGQDALQIYDGQPDNNGSGYDDYITPDEYWESEGGRARTQFAVSGNVFDITLWTWCGQAGEYQPNQIQQYLGFMHSLDGYNGSGLRPVLYTGHTNGTGPGGTLAINNAAIKQYAIDNGLALYDFYDIERYAPDGSGPYENDGIGYCEWCDQWCSDHPGDCQALPDSCAHSHPLVCKLEGQAFWHLLARLAGWDGVSR